MEIIQVVGYIVVSDSVGTSPRKMGPAFKNPRSKELLYMTRQGDMVNANTLKDPALRKLKDNEDSWE